MSDTSPVRHSWRWNCALVRLPVAQVLLHVRSGRSDGGDF